MRYRVVGELGQGFSGARLRRRSALRRLGVPGRAHRITTCATLRATGVLSVNAPRGTPGSHSPSRRANYSGHSETLLHSAGPNPPGWVAGSQGFVLWLSLCYWASFVNAHRGERAKDAADASAMPPIELLAELGTKTDLASLVERVSRSKLRWVVVSDSALKAWKERDPTGWEKVSDWLGAKGITIVRT